MSTVIICSVNYLFCVLWSIRLSVSSFFSQISASTVSKQITQPFWLKLWSWQWSNRFPCAHKKAKWSDDDSLCILLVGAVAIDVGSSKGRVRPQRCRVFGSHPNTLHLWGLFSVALWSARLKRLRHWRGSISTLVLAASQPSPPSLSSIWSPQHYQHQYQHHYQHHYQYHYQYHYQQKDRFCCSPKTKVQWWLCTSCLRTKTHHHYCTLVLGPCCRCPSEAQNCTTQRTLTLACQRRQMAAVQPSLPSVNYGCNFDGWSHQHYQHPYHHRDHPSLQCQRSPSWVERRECWFWCKCKYNGAPGNRCGASCRLLRWHLSWLADSQSRFHRRKSHRQIPTCNPRNLVMPCPRTLNFSSGAISFRERW